MIPILNLSDLLILSILLKLNAVPFVRIFRSNKYVRDVIQRSQSKLSSCKKPVHESLSFAVGSSMLTLRHETRLIARKIKHDFPVETNSVPEIVKETLCYFRLNSLRDHGLLCNNPLTPEILKIEADKLATGWSAFINEVLADVRPKILKLQVFEQKFQEGNRLDIELLKTLNMDEICIRDGTLCNDRLNYLLKTVAPFTKRLQINVTWIDRTEFHVTKNSIRALVQMVMDNEHGRFQHFHLSTTMRNYPQLQWALEFDDQFSPISNYKRAHKDFPEKSVAWTIPLKQGFIFVNTACYNNELHFDVVVCPDFESLQNWYNGHAGEATRNIAEIWERGNGRGSTCQRNVIKRRAPARAAALAPPQRPVHVNNSKKTTTVIKTRCRRAGCFTDKNGRLRDKKGRFVKTK